MTAAPELTVAGRRYATAKRTAQLLSGDDLVTPAMVRRWADRDGLERRNIGRTVYYRLDQAATIEAAKAASTRGRPRQLDTDQPRA